MMIKLVSIVMAFSMAAVAGGYQDKPSCSQKNQTTAQAGYSEKSHASSAVKVRLAKLTESLQLTPAQVTKVNAIFDNCKAQCSTLTAKFAPLMDELHALKKAENPDYEAIKAKKAELKALKQQHATELTAHRADLVAKIKAVLTPDQVAKFEQVQSEILGDELTVVAGLQ